MLFLDEHTREFYVRWDDEAARAVSSLRLIAGAAVDDPDLTELVGELTVKSREFSGLWSGHPVVNCVSGRKFLRHPEVGSLELDFEVLASPDSSGHRVLMYTAEPGSAGYETLQLLGSLVAERSGTAGSSEQLMGST
ncbi:hypothetical protein BJ994_002902 [Arthrobacter pigmenti]|uniref:MmyB-like transcription regulator ligand binding domain-containing protein n=2 Tax=Arthrobacter pigmenti TaxID=271432 RepID=A0A846RXW7_9MICC|nr:hypothetical protein [Arthrobacter pigmenti]